MKTQWTPLFQYQYSDTHNSQNIYEQIFHTALQYRYNNINGLGVQITIKDMTDAVFGINAQDKVMLAGKEINGQKLKELFIVSIMLKQVENKFTKGDYFFISIPKQETSCDVAVFVVKKEDAVFATDKKRIILPEKHLPFNFQVKEYFDYFDYAGYESGISIPKETDIGRLSKMVAGYEEIVLVFMRNLAVFESEKFKDFFLKNPDTYLISVPAEITVDGKRLLELDSKKHNYIITFPNQKFSIESFNKPRLLLTEEEYNELKARLIN